MLTCGMRRCCWVKRNKAVTGMPGNHAFLSPSSSVRWYFCPPSAHLCEQFPDQGSVYASEGTEAHALCEFLLKKELGVACVDPRPSLQYYSAEMEECASGYVQFVMEKAAACRDGDFAPVVLVEQQLDLRDISRNPWERRTVSSSGTG